MGNAYSRNAPPLVEVSGPRSKILIPAGSSFSFHPPHDRDRDRGRHRYAEPSRYYPRRAHRGRSPPFTDITGDTEDLDIGVGRRRGFDDAPFEQDLGEMRGMRPRRRGMGMGPMRGMGAADEYYDEDMGMGGGFAGMPAMGGQYAYPGVGVGGGLGMAGGVGMAPMPGVAPMRQPGIAAGLGGVGMGLGGNGLGGVAANPYAAFPPGYGATGAPLQQGMPMPMQQGMPMQQPQPQPFNIGLQPQFGSQTHLPPRRVRTAPPAHGNDEEIVIDGAHHAEQPRRGQVPRRGVSFDSATNRHRNPANDFPREWVEGDPFLDACICPVECECRTGRRARFRKKLDDGRMESGTIRYEPGYRDGRPCRNGCTSHGVIDRKCKDRTDGGAKEACEATMRESRKGIRSLRKDMDKLGAMFQEMMMGNPEMTEMPPGLRGGRMSGMMPHGANIPGMALGMNARRDRRPLPGMGMHDFQREEDMEGFGAPPGMGMAGFGDPDFMNYQMSRPPPDFMDEGGGRRRGSGRRRGGGGFGRPPPPHSRPPGGGRRRHPTFEPEEDDFYMSGGRGGPPGGEFSGMDDDDAWTDAVDDDFGEDMGRGGRRGSPPGGGRRGGRRGMGRHMTSRGNRRQAHVEDDEEG
ncbi:hypothetical protein BDV96DRAFT_602065 [Lophiotrema nucula]|uniref:Uncharacterized protein n=1 Tax=Lophiotrema nucula TaxID=690887 RepID=A0A6A5YZW5_9PLEO|nr:hypothetical protein BDV96DRAFT_602065 [Lophiotrema nucula]